METIKKQVPLYLRIIGKIVGIKFGEVEFKIKERS